MTNTIISSACSLLIFKVLGNTKKKEKQADPEKCSEYYMGWDCPFTSYSLFTNKVGRDSSFNFIFVSLMYIYKAVSSPFTKPILCTINRNFIMTLKQIYIIVHCYQSLRRNFRKEHTHKEVSWYNSQKKKRSERGCQ